MTLELYHRGWTPGVQESLVIILDNWAKLHPNIAINVIKGSTGKSREYLITNGLIGEIADVFEGQHYFSNEFGPKGYFQELQTSDDLQKKYCQCFEEMNSYEITLKT